MPGYRHRYMYYATGLPGWMRFGFSPGWLGTSPPPQGQNAQPTKEQEVEFLRTQADKLRGELERIKERLAQLE